MPNNLLHFPSDPQEKGCPPSGPSDVGSTETQPPLDQPARDQALEITASWIVEAPAGSGKTGLLMQRFLKLLASDTVQQPEEVLAITFTRKATAELRERVLAQLHKASPRSIPSTNLSSRPERSAVERPAAGTTSTPEPSTPQPSPLDPEPWSLNPGLSPFDQTSQTLAAAVLARDAQQNWGLLTRPQRLNIRTIDSIAAEIAATLPLLSGSGAPRTPSENADPLYHLAARRTLMQLGGPNPRLSAAIRDILLHRDGSLSDCETLLARMLQQREQWGELVPLGPDLEDDALETIVRPRLERALEQIVCAGLTRAAHAMPPDMLIALSWLAARLAHEPGYKDFPNPLYICANKSDPPETQAEHFDHWTALIGLLVTNSGDWRKGFNVDHVGLKLSPDDKALLKELIDQVRHDTGLCKTLCAVRELPPARYPDNQWAVAKSLFHLLLRALAELKVLFAERQECDFTELTIAAKHALRSESGPADFASAAGATLRHLLVDEMQDTSSSQYELIEMLSQSWDGHSQTLFLVGDPKQSIYLFRQARVERFMRAMRTQRLGDIPLGVLHLTANFRSQATLVEDFNHNFNAIFPATDAQPNPNAIDVPFVYADPTRDPSPTAAALVWNTTLLGDPEKSSTNLSSRPERSDVERPAVGTTPNSGAPFVTFSPSRVGSHNADLAIAASIETSTPTLITREQNTLIEARTIRQRIELWQAKPLPPGRTAPWTIAILARARHHLAPTIAELNRHNIPYRANEIELLNNRPEVLDVLALTRALLHPADRAAWLAILRAPWCGLGLADLLALAGNGLPGTLAETIPATAADRCHLLTPDGQRQFNRIWPTLITALDERGRSSTATLVQRTWHSLGGDAALRPDQLTNVDAFLRALRQVESPGGRVDLAALNAAVARLYAAPRTGENLVDLSTIHRAKGLEWDVVFVPALERMGQSSHTQLLNWLELDSPSTNPADTAEASVILAPIYGKGGEPDALHTWLTRNRNAREAAERKRLFYVACTRAREELHLFAAVFPYKNGEPSVPRGSLLEAAWPAAAPHFAEIPSSSSVEIWRQSLENESSQQPTFAQPTFALAAAAEPALPAPPTIQRLPLSFNPLTRLTQTQPLPYTPANALQHLPAFDRPEGSFAVRAFGNVVHRFLQLLADRLAALPDFAALAAELPSWLPRLTASLRAEGLPPSQLDRLAPRALSALQQSLADPRGLWTLTPHPGSRSEHALRTPTGELRVDRTFLAGPTPLSTGTTHLWIVDYKTTEQGSRSDTLFDQQERAKYSAQLETYARALTALGPHRQPIMLALYYPLIPRLISWPSHAPEDVSETLLQH